MKKSILIGIAIGIIVITIIGYFVFSRGDAETTTASESQEAGTLEGVNEQGIIELPKEEVDACGNDFDDKNTINCLSKKLDNYGEVCSWACTEWRECGGDGWQRREFCMTSKYCDESQRPELARDCKYQSGSKDPPIELPLEDVKACGGGTNNLFEDAEVSECIYNKMDEYGNRCVWYCDDWPVCTGEFDTYTEYRNCIYQNHQCSEDERPIKSRECKYGGPTTDTTPTTPTEGSCQPIAGGCSSLTGSDCTFQEGCNYDSLEHENCVGTPKCSGWGQDMCETEIPGCEWVGPDEEPVTTGPCESDSLTDEEKAKCKSMLYACPADELTPEELYQCIISQYSELSCIDEIKGIACSETEACITQSFVTKDTDKCCLTWCVPDIPCSEEYGKTLADEDILIDKMWASYSDISYVSSRESTLAPVIIYYSYCAMKGGDQYVLNIGIGNVYEGTACYINSRAGAKAKFAEPGFCD